MKVYGAVSSAEDSPLLKRNTNKSETSSHFKRIAAATLLAGGALAVASKNTNYSSFAIGGGRNYLRVRGLGDALDDAKAEAAKIRTEAEACREKSDCVEEFGASITETIDEFADTLTDLGRDANSMVQGVTNMADAMDKLKSAAHVGELGSEDVAGDAQTAVEDAGNAVTDAATEASNSVQDAAKHSVEDLQGAVATAQKEAEKAAADAQACTSDVDECWTKAVDKMQADLALAKVKAQLWEAKAKKAAEDAASPVEECFGDVAACAKKAQDDAEQAAQDVEAAAKETGAEIQECAADIFTCYEQATAKAKADVEKTTSDLQKCAGSASDCFNCMSEADPGACISSLTKPGVKSQLGTEDAEEDAEDSIADIQGDFEDAKAKADAAGKDWQACASDIASCATDTEAKAKTKLEADAAMAKAKWEMMEAAVTSGVTSGMAEFSDCADDIADCANKKVAEAKADAEAAKKDVDDCVADGQACIAKAASGVKNAFGLLGCDDKPDDNDLMAKTSAELEEDVAKFKADAEASGAELQACASDFDSCGEKMKAKMTADAKMAQAKAALMAKQVEEGTTASSEHFQECVGDVDAVKKCIADDVEAAKAKSEGSWAKLQSCTASMDALQSCFSELTNTFSLGEGEDVVAQAEAKASAAGDELKNCFGDVAECGEKMQAKMQADVDALKTKADLMAKQAQEDATASSAQFEHCVGGADAMKECVTASVEKAKSDAEDAENKTKACFEDLPACFSKMFGKVKDTFSLGCHAEQEAFDAAQSEAQAAAEKVKSTCDPQSELQECLSSLVDAAKADAAAASAKVTLMAEQAKDSASGVTDDMVADAQGAADAAQAKFDKCSANPSWENCKPEAPPQAALLGGSITEDIQECFSDVPECWNKLVGKTKKDAEDAEAKAKEAEQNAEAAAEDAKNDTSSAAKDAAAKVQEEADALKAKAEELGKEAQECASDPQACFQKLQGRLHYN